MKQTKFIKGMLIWLVLTIFSSIAVSAGSAVITPKPALSDNDLTCTATGGSGYYNYYWYEGGTLIQSITWTTSTTDILDSGMTEGGYTYTCKVDDSVSSDELGRDSVEVVAVTSVQAVISPDPAYTTDNLTCSHDGTSEFGYFYRWYNNGILQGGLTTERVDSSYTARDDTWKCEVVHGLAQVVVGEYSINISNIPPVADPQNVETPEDTAVLITLTGSDGENDILTFLIDLAPSNGILSSINPNTGEVTYTPNLDFNGADSFTFMANDGIDNSTPATVDITITPVNDAPVVGDIINVSFDEDGSNSSIDLDNYVTDVDLDLINWTYAGNSNVLVIIDENNTVTFSAVADWNGIETITFTAADPFGLN
ncbi:cadherin-like domain-containing protein, partial [Candidatus Woesearchaeota archaeon]|nr:cadherin-like domain-containing protein [Candidatus Woesearchaeota archaeon]